VRRAVPVPQGLDLSRAWPGPGLARRSVVKVPVNQSIGDRPRNAIITWVYRLDLSPALIWSTAFSSTEAYLRPSSGLSADTELVGEQA
jgi:hypothetical protein